MWLLQLPRPRPGRGLWRGHHGESSPARPILAGTAAGALAVPQRQLCRPAPSLLCPPGWAEAGGEPVRCWGRMGLWIRSGPWRLSFLCCSNFTCSCPEAAGDKHGVTVLCVSCDLSSARVCLALRISHE